MSGQLVVRGARIGGSTGHTFRPYKYGGDVPVDKDPEIHKSTTHGTASAARLHYLRGEKPCDACKESERARWREAKARRKERGQKPAPGGFTPEKCGTNAGHQRHIYYGGKPCDACMIAHRAYQQARRAARKEARHAVNGS